MSTISQVVTRVLVVDEIAETADLIKLILQKSDNCEVMLVDHPTKALPVVESGNVDLVLCEAFHGSDASLVFCRKVKSAPNIEHIPIIFYSEIHDRTSMLKGFDAGAVDYLFKPLFPMELAARVKTHFRLKKQKDLTLHKIVEQQELIHIMCHDLTSPLGASLTLLELSQDDPELLTSSLNSIIGSLRKAMELTELVRQLQAIEDGKKEWVLEPLSLRDAVEDALTVFQERLARKQLKVANNIGPEFRVCVERVSFINSVVSNLLSNAIKFSERGSTITMSAKHQDDRVVFSVEDTGIGMPKWVIENLFSLKQPTSRDGTENEKGTGYGLPLVNKFVHHYKGEINISTKDIRQFPEDHGTRVELRLLRA